VGGGSQCLREGLRENECTRGRRSYGQPLGGLLRTTWRKNERASDYGIVKEENHTVMCECKKRDW
jgi:hypothetical protein